MLVKRHAAISIPLHCAFDVTALLATMGLALLLMAQRGEWTTLFACGRRRPPT
jgi:hypothetical protein